MYKFVGVNVTHLDFIKRYSRLGPRELTSPPRMEGKEMEAMTCDKLAHCLLLRTSHDPNARTKFEVGKTKIFIRCAERLPLLFYSTVLLVLLFCTTVLEVG